MNANNVISSASFHTISLCKDKHIPFQTIHYLLVTHPPLLPSLPPSVSQHIPRTYCDSTTLFTTVGEQCTHLYMAIQPELSISLRMFTFQSIKISLLCLAFFCEHIRISYKSTVQPPCEFTTETKLSQTSTQPTTLTNWLGSFDGGKDYSCVHS